MGRQHGWGLLVLWLLVPSSAEATFMEMLGVGARAMSMGSAYTGVSDDVLAIYYNPAGLAQLRTHELLLGYLWSNPKLHADSPQEPGFHAEQIVPYHLECPEIGLAFNLDSLFGKVLPLHTRIGILNLTPENFKTVYRAWDVDFSTPRWFRYGDYWDRVHLEGALSMQPDKLPWVSFGVGFRFIISGDAFMVDRKVDGYNTTPGLKIDLVGHAEGNMDLGVDTEVTPTAGVMFYPTPGLRVGYCFRNSLSLVLKPMVTQAVTIIIPGKLEVPITMSTSLEAYYMPQEHTFGASYQWSEKFLTSFDLSWFRWSGYAPESRGRPDPAWSDIFIPRLGLEYRVLRQLALRFGYFFEPSPVPNQNKDSNFIDNDRHVFSAGIGYTIEDPTHFVRQPMNLDVVVQYMYLPTRKTVKDPLYKVDFESSGDGISIGGNLTFHF